MKSGFGRIFWLISVLCLVQVVPALAQQIRIEIGNTEVPINQYFTISVVIENERLQDISRFPEIEGFQKSTRYTSTSTRITGNQQFTTQTIVQNYAAIDEGTFRLKPFKMKVNGQTIESEGAEITVGPMQQQAPPANAPPLFDAPSLEELMGTDEPKEFIDKQEDAFLHLNIDKDAVYVGEDLHVALDFYVAATDVELLDFHDFINQLTELVERLKPKNVWEEAFERSEISPVRVMIEEKEYIRFRLYEAVYFPLKSQAIDFPALSLLMIKYKVAKNPTFFGDNVQQTFKTYYSRPKIVNVKELPPHPLKDAVPVGNYRLLEAVDRKSVEVNKSFNYLFQIQGIGNLSAITAPPLPKISRMEFYTPEVVEDISRRNERVSGRKSFKYFAIPKVPGTYQFKDYFSFIFFNPYTERYDTLQSELVMQVTGERDMNAAIQSRDVGSFYSLIGSEDNHLISLHKFEEIKLYTNIVILLLIGISVFIFLKK